MCNAGKKLHAAVVTELDQQEAAILDLLKNDEVDQEVWRANKILEDAGHTLASDILSVAMARFYITLAEQTGDLDS